MIGRLMFLMLMILVPIGVPPAFSMGLSAVLLLRINGSDATVIAQKAVNGLDFFTIVAIPFFIMAASPLSGTDVGVKISCFSAPWCGTCGRPGPCERVDRHDRGGRVRLCRVRCLRHRQNGDGGHGGARL